ncbi:MAG: NAD(P)H-dependent oxidoreductase subunit E [Spirochaetales bacterium]|nr:MAG: NAD(P)H-dependent oxidoreductase subunit E [Spirochaetales bacterium]
MDNSKLTGLVERYRNESGTVIGLLQDMHEELGYLPEDGLRFISKEIEVPLSTLYGLATFYSTFRLEPMGKHHICTCVGTACHVKGAPFVVDTIERELGIKAGETTKDGNFTLDTVNCLGACALAPLVVVDGEYYGKTDQQKVLKILGKHQGGESKGDSGDE